MHEHMEIFVGVLTVEGQILPSEEDGGHRRLPRSLRAYDDHHPIDLSPRLIKTRASRDKELASDFGNEVRIRNSPESLKPRIEPVLTVPLQTLNPIEVRTASITLRESIHAGIHRLGVNFIESQVMLEVVREIHLSESRFGWSIPNHNRRGIKISPELRECWMLIEQPHDVGCMLENELLPLSSLSEGESKSRNQSSG